MPTFAAAITRYYCHSAPPLRLVCYRFNTKNAWGSLHSLLFGTVAFSPLFSRQPLLARALCCLTPTAPQPSGVTRAQARMFF